MDEFEDLTPEELEELEKLYYDIHGICERCYKERNCAVFRGKLLCKECIDEIRLHDGLVAYV